MSQGAPQVLVLLRHGVAEDIDSRPTDDERELTTAGRADADLAAQGLVALGIRPDVVVSSPLIRCHQTAEMVARAAGCPLHDDPRLAPGMTTDDLLDLVIDFPDAHVIVACSHQPGLTYALSDITGCGEIGFHRPQAAVISLTSPRPGGGSLVALLPPRVLRAAAPESGSDR